MPSAISTHLARYAVLTAAETPVGVLLEDPETNELYVRLRRDWGTFSDDEEREVLELLEDDLLSKGREMGAGAVLSWLEENASNIFRVTDREEILAAGFPGTLNRLYTRHVQSNVLPFQTHLPRYTLRAAAGRFLENEEISEDGWVETPRDLHLLPDMFVAQIAGHSMEPLIPDASTCVFRHGVVGSRTGRLVLAESLESTGTNRYAVKRYRRDEKSGAVWLESLNPDYPRWELEPDEDKYRIIAEFLRVLD